MTHLEAHPSGMHINYQYLLDFIARQAGIASRPIKILDYGCGDGLIVETGRKRGLQLFGADIFYAGSNSRQVVSQKGLLGNIILEIRDHKVAFPAREFDLIISNQVFEHVEHLEPVLEEINRILKPGGQFLALFPSRDVWREGHTGIPFLHWFPKESGVRRAYLNLMRSIGLGKYKHNLPKQEWMDYILNWLDTYCFYRSRAEIKRAFKSHFDIRFIEHDYIKYRLRTTRYRGLAPLAGFALTRPVVDELFRKLGGLVILADKPDQERK